MLFPYQSIKHFLLSVTVVLMSIVTYGQRVQEFNDSMELKNGFKGVALYKFTNSKGKQGEFLFYQHRQDTVKTDYSIKNHYQGSFQNNQKQGEWVYAHKYMKPDGTPVIKDYEVVHYASGKEFILNAIFDKNAAIGKWEATLRNIMNGSPKDSIWSASAQFRENNFYGSFLAKSDSVGVKGNVDENGFLDGEWIFKHILEGKLLTEKRLYSSGILTLHQLEHDNKTYEIKHIGLDQTVGDGEDWREVEMSKDYFDIIYQTNFGKINGGLEVEFTNQVIARSNTFLKRSLQSFNMYQDMPIWLIQDGDELIRYPKLKVRRFDYTKEEERAINSAVKIIQELQANLADFLEDPQVDINKHAYKEISLYYEIYKVYQDQLNKLERVFARLNSKAYQYIDRSEIMPFIFSGIDYPTMIEYEYENRKIKEEVAFPANLISEEADVLSLYEHLTEMQTKIAEKKKIVDPIIERNRKRLEIAEKETRLVKKRDSIQKLFNNALDLEDYNYLHELYSENVLSYTQQSFKAYAKLEVGERIEKTDELLKCFEDFLKLYQDLISIESKLTRIDELYTRVVWNPFTFTDMEEIVKERVYNAYKNVLLPHLLNDLKSRMDCNNLRTQVQYFNLVYNRMTILRSEDTKEKEKALRRVTNPKTVAEILEIKIEFE